MKSAVSLARCGRYEEAPASLSRCLEALGGMRAFVRPGDRTLLKVNLVSPHDEAAAVTTHSALVAAVIDEVRRAGGVPFVGDSPALVTAGAVAKRCGLRAVCAAKGAPIVDLCDPVVVPNPGARLARAFQLSNKLRSFDVMVNLPKLKTHCFQGMTGAVKNLFGCIPGKLKTAHHLTHTDPLLFAETLLDLHDTIPPRLTIVDAVVGMEGPGPGSGTPRPFNLVIAGADATAIDAVCARIMGFSEREVPTLWQARRRGIRQAEVGEVEVIGERLRDVLVERLKKPRASATTYVPRFAMDLCKKMLTARPAVRRERCSGCADCSRICAPRAITMVQHAPRFDDDRCIRCFCCHEICPSAAIDLRAGLLARFLDGKSS